MSGSFGSKCPGGRPQGHRDWSERQARRPRVPGRAPTTGTKGNAVDLLDERSEEVLTGAECRWLLAGADMGRVCFTAQALPAILPVRFAIQAGRVVLPAIAGGRLASACRAAVVAFQVDSCDATGAWAVTVVGPCRVVTDPEETARLDRLELRPWSAAGRRCYVVVEMVQVSGWRAHAGPAQHGDLRLAGHGEVRATA